MMRGQSQGEPQNVRSAEWRRIGSTWRSMKIVEAAMA